VVALAPVADLTAAARDRLGDGATQALLGGSPDEVPEAYAAADPMYRLDSAPGTTALVILHGSRDDVVPLSQSRALADQHPRVELRVLDADHFDVIDPTSHVWPHVLDAITGQGDG
jgi:pimeloyl-ACP methyl ester carboxylesterase